MADVRTLPDAEAEAPPSPTHATIRREDYRPPDWLVPEIALKFTLGAREDQGSGEAECEAQSEGARRTRPFCSTATTLSRSVCGSTAPCRTIGR